jgi:hypothetical protein
VVAIAVVVVAISVLVVARPGDGAGATPTPIGSLVGSLGLPATGTPGVSAPGVSASASVPSGSPGSVASGSGGTGTTIDPTLLAALPLTVDGVTLAEDKDTERPDASDPMNGADLAGLAVAVAVDDASGDLAVASVVHVRPGIFSDAYYSDWRSTFDTGACSQAGGVSAHGSAVIAGRDAFTATCAGGLVTYHVHLDDRDLIVSVSSLGQRQFGRLILEGIR